MPEAFAENKNVCTKSQQLYQRAKQLIPGGTQLLSKRPEMFAPNKWPSYYRSAKGCEIVDLDGNTYIDMMYMGIGACLLGYADPEVTEAVVRRVCDGAMCTLNAPDEVTLAEKLLELHPWADNVRYARTGGEAMTVAVRIARSATGRDVIAFCGYHGWHDWYLAANCVSAKDHDPLDGHLLPGLSARGVPSNLTGTAIPFTYNNLEMLQEIVRMHGDNLAAVVMEPTRNADPKPGFLEGVRELCDQSGAVLVIDEITAGWRFAFGGAHLRYGLQPDIAVFAKSLGNGHPMAAIIGQDRFMRAAQDSFISSTYWTESVGPAAALATLDKMRQIDVPKHVRTIGQLWQAEVREAARQYGVPVKITGHPALTYMTFDHPDTAALETLLTIRMLDHGILAGSSFYPSWAHEERHVEAYVAAAEIIFKELSEAMRNRDVFGRIEGLVKHNGFVRLA
jgi:glutamate-1-semialdehyde 2,1-aminomutase